VTATATDAAGNAGTCTFIVMVQDISNPTITCPDSIESNAAATDPFAVVSWDAPATSDNWGVETVNSTIASGSNFDIGSTNVTYTVTDKAGLTANCSFTVAVKDVTPPIIRCPGCPDSRTVDTDTDKHYATITLAAATATDNSGAVIPQCMQSSGQYQMGPHSVSL